MTGALAEGRRLRAALTPPTCIGNAEPGGMEGTVSPGQLCHGRVQRFPGDVEVAEDGTDDADTSKREQYLQGSKGNLFRGPSSPACPSQHPICCAPASRSFSCHVSQGAMSHLPLQLQGASQALLLQHPRAQVRWAPPASPTPWERCQNFSPLPLLPAPSSAPGPPGPT